MAEETALAIREQALERLTADERVAFERYDRAGKPGVAPDYNQRLYDLFLRGVDCTAISLLNPGLGLGAVCKARIDGKWDERRDSYTAELLTETNGLLRQTAAEALQFLSLVLAVAHREHGEALKRYLATGDPKELGDFRIQNFGHYSKIIDTIAKLIGADQKKTVTHRVVGGVSQESDEGGTGIVGALGNGRLTPKQADAMRAAMEKEKG